MKYRTEYYIVPTVTNMCISFLFQLDFGGLFNFGGDAPAVDKDLRSEPSNIVVEETYTVPEERSLDRPHMMGWFERLNAREGEKVRLGEMPSGSVVEGDA